MANWLAPVSWVSQRFEFGLKSRSDHGLRDLYLGGPEFSSIDS